ncbi:Predicted kinase, aminoglycoside phosphotransferase (APT) family [Streptomyces sp. 1222.5]|uniref:phosphotransferase family protein n=1 Tax=unclassified Streptomyces TaxID=2593676 RepID=UPI00089BA17B|nr:MULTISPECIES: phosphotransferase [unclassified Streptomyces]PKW12355.1 aminoglycoside phosphotransferase (APT) family kinase protein [Streptomyces sp. 5112.2]SEB57779.1 Predicted kinase, aminoglycoside phosphotransferase (APT) family [Streptomyces sp. 1222.5]
MVTGEDAEHIGTDLAAKRWDATRAWAEKQLVEGEHIEAVVRLRGGWTSEMRRLDVRGPGGRRSLVLRSFIRPFFVRHAEGLLTREAAVLRLLDGTDIPAARLVSVDAAAEYCDHPSLLMSRLPGTLRLGDEDAEQLAELLARQLLRIHRLPVTVDTRPRDYQAWTSPERVRPPAYTAQPRLWQRAVDVIRREPPQYRACFLHRDFHPGNVLFTGDGDGLRVSGVVDWVETSWGPADLDVAHCSTALALLHGVSAGMQFADRYLAAGGTLTDDPVDHLYWRLLDALAFAPDAEKVAAPWREVGRADLTPTLLTRRLEGYTRALLDRYA